MATIKVIEDPDTRHSSKDRSKKDKRDKKHKKSSTSELKETSSAGFEDISEALFENGMQPLGLGEFDGDDNAGSMMFLSMDETERARLLVEEDESSVSTVEDGSSSKGTSYYINHQRYIESSVLTPLEEVCDPNTSPLSSFVIENLKSMGMQKLFPVQAEVIPFILRSVMWGGDVCVCAPTGSGKTLAYVIPIIEALHRRTVKRLRALVLVPTHDLVVQVSNVFLRMVEGTDLVVEALYGNKGFEGEQRRLVEPRSGSLSGGSSMVDIIVTTPGRLVDHLQETPGFTLQHLQFLVLDEADRLLMHSFQDWLPKVLEAIHQFHEGHMSSSYQSSYDNTTPSSSSSSSSSSSIYSSSSTSIGSNNDNHHTHHIIRDKLAMRRIDPVTNHSRFLNVAVMERSHTHLQKLLFSATLTQNPEKIDSLRLVNPQYFTATSSTGKTSFLYTIPETLEQNLSVCTEQHKPLLLLHILTLYKDAQTLCFVGSIETAHRLTLLLKFLHAEQFINNNPIYEYSSSLSQQERNQIILKFKSGAPGVIICSDVMARGLDIQNVRAVVNYDLPFHVKTYVHRVGRTGRAGRAGTSWSIALKEEVRKFKSSLSKAENSNQNYIPLPYEDIKQHFGRYREALRQLQIEMERENGAAATAQSLLHASFSLPLDSNNYGDKKSILTSLQRQVTMAWFPEDVHTLFSLAGKVENSSSSSSSLQGPSTVHIPSSATTTSIQNTPNKLVKPKSSETTTRNKKIFTETKDSSKPKRKRRNKKSELDSLSLSSDSSSSDSESSDGKMDVTNEPKTNRTPGKEKSSVSAISEPSFASSRAKNRKKRKRGELESLSLSSSSSSSSDSEEETKKREKSRSRSKNGKDKHKKSSK
jgi:ATP-dependent RNA helicase DDX51/DBP6